MNKTYQTTFLTILLLSTTALSLGDDPSPEPVDECAIVDHLHYMKISIPDDKRLVGLKKLENTPQDTEIYLDFCLIEQGKIKEPCKNLSKDKKYFLVHVDTSKAENNCQGLTLDEIKNFEYQGSSATLITCKSNCRVTRREVTGFKSTPPETHSRPRRLMM